jgi:hypothetical protein
MISPSKDFLDAINEISKKEYQESGTTLSYNEWITEKAERLNEEIKRIKNDKKCICCFGELDVNDLKNNKELEEIRDRLKEQNESE